MLGIGVTIFASHHDNYIMTQNLSSVYNYQASGSGQLLQARHVNLSPGLAKIAPYLPCRRGSFSDKVPGLVAGWLRQVTLTAHTRWLL
jgi:hypothetical protein